MYEKTVKREWQKAKQLPLTTIRYAGSEIFLLRTDILEAGVKQSIGRCLVAEAIESGHINASTKALVVQGAGNTVTAVHQAVKEMHLWLKVIAVVYAETSSSVKERLIKRGITVITKTPRSEGQDGRRSTAIALCEDHSGHVLIEQHEQPTIIDIQKRTFGRRIAEAMVLPATHFVAGVGTGGTLFGISAALRENNPHLNAIGVEGVGSTLTLWHTYLRAQGSGFANERSAIEVALQAYQNAGMITQLDCDEAADPSEWFDIKIQFPENTEGVVGIEGLGVGNPTGLIMEHLSTLSGVRIVTDAQAHAGVQALESLGIYAVESAGANFFSAMKISEELRASGRNGRIATIVTAHR